MADARVAVVDHDATYLRLVKRILELDGLECVVVPVGSAFDVIVEEQPDLIMLDTWLSNREEGWILLQSLLLEQRVSTIPVVVCTADITDFENRVSGLESRTPIRMLKKPFTPDGFLAKVHEALAGRGAFTGGASMSGK